MTYSLPPAGAVGKIFYMPPEVRLSMQLVVDAHVFSLAVFPHTEPLRRADDLTPVDYSLVSFLLLADADLPESGAI